MDDLLNASRLVTIVNEEGLHLRPATLFLQLARRFQSRIEVVKDHNRVDGKTEALQLIALGAQMGDQVVLHASGPDAEEAVAALAALIAGKFRADPAPNQITAED